MTNNQDGNENTIQVLGLSDPQDRWIFSRGEERYERATLRVSDLKERLEEFVESMDDVLSGIPNVLADYNVDKLTISIGVTAKGTVAFLGTGGELGGNAGITMELTRHTASDT